jgi:two-component system cell cycle sensor histidine kinase/response regulator CckA
MGDGGPAYEIEPLQQRVDTLRRRAAEGAVQPGEVLPEAFSELQRTLEELQVAQEELVLTRQTVEAERQRYQELFNLAPDGYLATDAHGTIQEANRAATTLLNCPQGFLVGKPLVLFVAESEREAFHTRLRQLLEAGRAGEWEVWMQPQDGPSFDASLTVAIAPDPEGNKKISLYWLLRDITERKRAEEMLRAAEERYHSLFENALEGIFRSTPEGRFLDVNPALARMLGYESVEEVLALKLPDDLYVDPGQRERLQAGYEAAGVLDGVELLWKKKSGEPIVVSLYAKAIRDAEGKIYYEGMVLDITERERMEQKLRESEKLAASGRLAAGIAHEINNPLASIKNSFLLIRDAVPAHHPYYHYVGLIEQEIDRITRIIRQMYALYRPEQEGAREFAVEEAIRDVVALLHERCHEQGARITVELPHGPLVVCLPETSLRQVLFNIIGNAIDASPREGVVTVAATVRQDHLCLAVTDHGGGIPEAIRDQIFEPFFTTKSDRPRGGLGLGLSVSKSLVEAMGGVLDFHSQVGQGTVFEAVVPMRQH